MFAEGFDLANCRIDKHLQVDEARMDLLDGELPPNLSKDARLTLVLKAAKTIAHAQMHGKFGGNRKAALTHAPRRTLSGGSWTDLPLYRVEEQVEAVQAEGPCVLEEAFFTCRIEKGWRFEINEARDILVSRA